MSFGYGTVYPLGEKSGLAVTAVSSTLKSLASSNHRAVFNEHYSYYSMNTIHTKKMQFYSGGDSGNR